MNWYKDGLNFECTGCGGCCTGCPGYVWLSEKDIENAIKFLKISRESFLKKYTRWVNNRLSLIEDSINYDCCFLKDKKCQIYEARPFQCKQFPWWKDNLRSPDAWENAKKQCPGINSSSKLFSFEEIEEKSK